MPESSPAMAVQRVGFLVFAPALLRRLGVDPSEVLPAAGLEVSALDHPEATIPYIAMGRFAAIASATTQCPHLGLLIGDCIGTASLGLVGELMRNAPTLGVALEDFAAYQHRNSNGGLAYLLKYKEIAFFGYAVCELGVEGNSVICDAAAMAAFRIIRELLQINSLRGMEIFISRAEPPDLAPYRSMFGVNVHFDADHTAALVPIKWLDRPVPGADAGLRRTLEQRMKELSSAGELDLITQLRRQVRIALLSGQVSGDAIAAQLGLNRRTLHRHLAGQGTTFQRIQDEIRCEFARQLLAYTRLSIARVSLIVRYSDPGIFTRAFARWTGFTPSEWRSNLELKRSEPSPSALGESNYQLLRNPGSHQRRDEAN